jgi:hypothetical protein
MSRESAARRRSRKAAALQQQKNGENFLYFNITTAKPKGRRRYFNVFNEKKVPLFTQTRRFHVVFPN